MATDARRSDDVNAGDPIWYRHRQHGGYGFETEVPGTFVRATARRFVVRLLLKSGEPKDVAVLPTRVRPRDPAAVWT